MTDKKITAARQNLEKARAVRAGKKAVPYSQYKPTPNLLGRLMITVTPGAEVGHWMPKDGDQWSCPDCGAQYERLSTGWSGPVTK